MGVDRTFDETFEVDDDDDDRGAVDDGLEEIKGGGAGGGKSDDVADVTVADTESVLLASPRGSSLVVPSHDSVDFPPSL